MGRGLAMTAARRVRHAMTGQSVFATPAMMKQAKTYDYERVNLAAAERRAPRPIRLGGRNRIRIAGLQGLFHTPGSILSRLWASYGRLRDTAKETNVNVSDLFVGNQMLMHVCATPMRSCKKKTVAPIAAASRNPKITGSPPKVFRVGKSPSFRHR